LLSGAGDRWQQLTAEDVSSSSLAGQGSRAAATVVWSQATATAGGY